MVARLAGPVALDTSHAKVYLNAGESAVVVTGIHVANTSAASIGFSLFLLAAGVTEVVPSQSLWSQTKVPGNGVLDWTGSLPVNPGESLVASANSNDDLVLVLTG